MENTVGVRADHDAGANFVQFGRLLEKRHVDACAAQRERRDESADPGSDYDDSHVRHHPPTRAHRPLVLRSGVIVIKGSSKAIKNPDQPGGHKLIRMAAPPEKFSAPSRGSPSQTRFRMADHLPVLNARAHPRIATEFGTHRWK